MSCQVLSTALSNAQMTLGRDIIDRAGNQRLAQYGRTAAAVPSESLMLAELNLLFI
jgi:hypothetical protein